MNGSKNELEERVAAAEKMLKDVQETLARTHRLIEQTRKLLDEAQRKEQPEHDEP